MKKGQNFDLYSRKILNIRVYYKNFCLSLQELAAIFSKHC
ncbi:hypothetical protein HMPREF9136_0920 [Prevotella dentalis DSM 3688]|uniref:Uncharacterized protein n=1 Tax=Prevotella dentalis (strain ATCC 49559 / DSM 3688 / JCM 13448 / NCTC 12043 / ES 2772) TaxID=908937 RepID=F9D242_PREDD|nr:hypothetical protein HMPREF9136_0920 [Prevotella dentalis DSM 3688]